VFPDGYPRDSDWSHLVIGGNDSGGSETNKLKSLMSMGFDLEGIISELDSPEDKAHLIREVFSMLNE